MGSGKRPEGSKTAESLKLDFTFRRLVSELEKLSLDRKESLMRHLDESNQGNHEESVMLMSGEVAKILGLTSATIRRWLREGKIKGIKIARTWLIPKEEVNRILSEV